jgi:hypothetical protein
MLSDSPEHDLPLAAFLDTLGGDRRAYVKPIRSDDLHRLYPAAPVLQPGMQLYALHASDGTPILITDSAAVAKASAKDHELEAVSLH